MPNQINTEIYFNTEIYLNNLTDLEDKYQHLYWTFESHDDWVDFISDKL